MTQSLKVTSGWIKRVKQALSRHSFPSQKALSEELGLSRHKVSNFFNGNLVDSESFVSICQRLELEWQKVAKVSPTVPAVTSTSAPASAKTVGADANQQQLQQQQLQQQQQEQQEQNEGIPRLASRLFKANISGAAHRVFGGEPAVELRRKQLPKIAIEVPDDEDEQEIDPIQPLVELLKAATHREEDTPIAAKTEVSETKQFSATSAKVPPVSAADTVAPSVQPKPISSTEIPVKVPAISVAETVAPPEQPKPISSTEVPVKVPAISTVDTVARSEDPEPILLMDISATFTADAEEEASSSDRVRDDRRNEADRIDAILKIYHDACAAEDWDTAVEAIGCTDWNYLRQIGELQLILDLHKGLLPENWREGGHKVSGPGKHAQVVHNAGIAYYYLGNLSEAAQHYDVAIAIAQKLEDPKLEMQILPSLGLVYKAAGQYQTAIKFYQQYLQLANDLGDSQSQANALCHLGNTYYALRQYRAAITYYQRFLRIATEFGHLAESIYILGNLGNAYYNLGNYQKAIDYQQQYLDIAQTASDREKEAAALVSLGVAYAALGLDQTAIEHQQKALSIARRIAHRRLEMSALKGLGFSFYSLTNYQTAIPCYQRWLEIARELRQRDEQVQAMYHLRKAYNLLSS